MNDARDYVLFEGRTLYWPMCKNPGCGNRMNRKAGNGYCWPCQPSGKTFSELMDEFQSSTENVSEGL